MRIRKVMCIKFNSYWNMKSTFHFFYKSLKIQFFICIKYILNFLFSFILSRMVKHYFFVGITKTLEKYYICIFYAVLAYLIMITMTKKIYNTENISNNNNMSWGPQKKCNENNINNSRITQRMKSMSFNNFIEMII